MILRRRPHRRRQRRIAILTYPQRQASLDALIEDADEALGVLVEQLVHSGLVEVCGACFVADGAGGCGELALDVFYEVHVEGFGGGGEAFAVGFELAAEGFACGGETAVVAWWGFEVASGSDVY